MIRINIFSYIQLLSQRNRKIVIYSLVWLACYGLITLLYWLTLDSFGQDVGLPLNWTIARWLAAGHIIFLCIAYYWITRVLYPTIIRERWLSAALQAAGLYLLIGLITYFLYTAVGKSYANTNTQLSKYYTYFEQAGPFYSMTSKSIFLPNWWLYSILVTAVSLKISREVFHVKNQALHLEMNLLRAQINPHFLFNTLNNIYSLVEEKDAYAAEILLKFGDIMRYTLHETHANFVALEQEINMLNEYIELERIRHDVSAPAHITFDVSGDTHAVIIPPLLLITLVENSFKHGTQATIGSSWVHIHLAIDEQRMEFMVSNSKPTVVPTTPSRQKLIVHRVGLANIQRRLDLLYQDQHTLTIVDKPDTYTITLLLTKHGHSNLLFSR